MADWPFEWDYPRLLLVALGTVTLVALVIVASTSTAAFGTYNPAWDGASDLRDAARDAGADATVARNLDPYASAEPNRSVALVLSPREPYTPEEAATLRRFLEDGGTLVVAGDFGGQVNPLLARLGARSRINGTLLRDEREYYQSPAIPVATNVTEHPLTQGVDQLTVNHASAVDPDGAEVLVRTSEFAYADENRNGQLDDAEVLAASPVVTVESVGDGTLVVAGDPSLFINVMLERPGNRAFVDNLFAAHEVAILDYSHAGGFPPLALALLVLRDSSVLQVLVGLGGLALIGLWAGGRVPVPGRSGDGAVETPTLDEDELVAYLERRHPDWDDDRVRRVVRGIMSHRGQSRPDE